MQNWTGEKIIALRKKLGLTQTEFAKLLYVSRNTIFLAENNKGSTNKSLLLFFEILDKELLTVEQIKGL